MTQRPLGWYYILTKRGIFFFSFIYFQGFVVSVVVVFLVLVDLLSLANVVAADRCLEKRC